MHTVYGDHIEDGFLKDLSTTEIKSSVMALMEEEKLVSSSPLEVTFTEESVRSPGDPDSKSCSSIVPIIKWRTMMDLLKFREVGASTEGWKQYEMGGLNSEEFNYTQSSVARATFIEHRDWKNKRVSHSLVIHYRKSTGGFFVYQGNVEDLYEQVFKEMKPAYYSKIYKKFNL